MFGQETGEIIETSDWPVEEWRTAKRLAKAQGLTVGEYIEKAISRERDRLSVALAPDNLARINAMATIREMSPSEYADEILSHYLNDVYDGGRVVEIEIDRCARFKSRAQAMRVTAAAAQFDNEHSKWSQRALVYKKDSDSEWFATFRKEEA